MSEVEREGLPRREFLRLTSAGLVGAGLAAGSLMEGSAVSAARAEGPESGSSSRLPETDLNVYFGDLHVHTSLSLDSGTWGMADKGPAATFANGKKNRLDFAACTDHIQHAMPDFKEWMASLRGGPVHNTLVRGQVNMEDGALLIDWEATKKGVEEAYEPGSFVSILAYEWSSTVWGDHNVYFPSTDESIRRAGSLDELYAALDGVECLIIPHHPGYRVGLRGANWTIVDESRARVAEIMSFHGNSEEDGLGVSQWTNNPMGPRCGGGTARMALKMGKRLGFIASTDAHLSYPGNYGAGLAAVQATDLTRDAVYHALSVRRCYGVSGDRIVLDFRLNGEPMGSILSGQGARQRELYAFVDGWHGIADIEILKNGVPVKHFAGFEALAAKGSERFKLAVYWGWRDEPQVEPWNLAVSLRNGAIRGVQPCFTCWRPDLDHEILHLAPYGLELRSLVPGSMYQGLLLDIRGGLGTEIDVTRDGTDCVQARIAELLETSKGEQPWGHFKGSVYLSRAFAEPQFRATVHWADRDISGKGADSYYLRVRQKNGQMAWSSPIWVA